LLVVISLSTAGALSQSDSSRAFFPEPSWDFGYVPQKSEVSHTFYLHNRGSVPLSVKEVDFECACASAFKPEEPVAPGDSGAIATTFRSGRYRGHVRKSAKVETDDPMRPIQRLRFQAEVIRENQRAGSLSLIPPKLKWQVEESRLKLIADTILVVNNEDSPVDVRLVRSSEEIIDKIDLQQVVAPADTMTVVFSPTKKKLPAGLNGLSAVFRVAGNDTCVVTVPIELDD
jgi:hypothetical protein